MCPPTNFDVAYAINPWMDLAVRVDRDRAQTQWDALVATLRAAGAEVEILAPHPDLPDLVFTANLGLVDGEAFIPARMRHPERRDEPAHAEPWFAEHGYAIHRLSEPVTHEGAGDALPFAGTLLGGHGPRSTAAAYPELAELIGAPIVPVELVDARFYHLDITFCPLDDRSALVALGKLSAEGAGRVARSCPTRSS